MCSSEYNGLTTSHSSTSHFLSVVFLIACFAVNRATNAEMIHLWQNESPAIEWMNQANHSLFLADMQSRLSPLAPQEFDPFIDTLGSWEKLTNHTGIHSPLVVDGIGSALLAQQLYELPNVSTLSDLRWNEVGIKSSKELNLFFPETQFVPGGIYKKISLQNTTE